MTYSHHNTRRGLLAAAIIAPLAVVPASAGPDADLIRVAEEALSLHSFINANRDAEWPDDRLNAECGRMNALYDEAMATPATSLAGLQAKGRLLAVEMKDFGSEEPDRTERMVLALISDLIRQDRRVPS